MSKRITEEDARAMKLRPGTPAPVSGQYTMIDRRGSHYTADGKAWRVQCTMVKGRRLPSAGSAMAGNVWRLTDPTKRKRA